MSIISFGRSDFFLILIGVQKFILIFEQYRNVQRKIPHNIKNKKGWKNLKNKSYRYQLLFVFDNIFPENDSVLHVTGFLIKRCTKFFGIHMVTLLIISLEFIIRTEQSRFFVIVWGVADGCYTLGRWSRRQCCSFFRATSTNTSAAHH